MINIFKKDLFKTLDNMEKLNISKDDILRKIDSFNLKQTNKEKENALMRLIAEDIGLKAKDIMGIMHKFDLSQQDQFGYNLLMIILRKNENFSLGFKKQDILSMIDKFDLRQRDFLKENVLMYIIYYSKYWGFTKNDILSILDKFDLTAKDDNGYNILMMIVLKNKNQKLGFNKSDILKMLDKFDLTQKTKDGYSIYDIIKSKKTNPILDLYFKNFNDIDEFNDKELSILISKLDIESRDKKGNFILVKELENGLCFNSENMVSQLLNTDNEEIIDSVYKHIGQIKWKHKELLEFLKKNNLKMDEKSCFSMLN